jgi:cytochrome d ubiquinol oxidase subunit II
MSGSLLPVVWAAILAFAVFAYIVLDGFDLGTGILFLLERDRHDRDVMVNTIAPVWDGNETWLVLGGGGLFAAFPLAYAVILPAMYPLLISMLLALILRGVAFEFRFHATHRGRFWWDVAFCGGSLVAALCQGLILGGLIHGIHVVDNRFVGSSWDWFNGFSVLCGVAVVVGYTLLGACWLIWRTSGALRKRSRRYAMRLAVALLALIVGVSLWTPFLHPQFMARWFGWPGIVLTSPVPLLVAVVALVFWRTMRRRGQDVVPLLCAEAWFLLCYIGLGISFYPLIVPPAITIWQAASPVGSQAFLLVGAIVMLPIILAYMAYAYWTFRGKVTPGAQYH